MMSDTHTLGFWLRRFLTEHLVTERNLTYNTRCSYRDTFVLLLPFLSGRLRTPTERLKVADVTADQVRGFLDHLESRGCSVRTRNQRLTAIRSFARFVASREPAQLDWCAQIRAIPQKKAIHNTVDWLDRTQMQALLESPDRRRPGGRTEYAVLLFLYNTGARVSEAAALKVNDLELGSDGATNALVTLQGKGAADGSARCGTAPQRCWPIW